MLFAIFGVFFALNDSMLYLGYLGESFKIFIIIFPTDQ